MITDALGGVNVCLKEPVYEPLSGADFPAGWQKLNGPQALSFVRQRHDLPRGDLDRVVRQQVVMASLAHQVISGKTLSSPATMNRLQQAIQRSVVLSSRLGHHGFRGAAAEAGRRQRSPSPPSRCSTSPAGATTACTAWCGSIRIRCRTGSRGLLHDQAQGKTEELAYTPDKTTASVVNDTDINGLAAAVSEVLTAKGFAAGMVGNNDAAHVAGSQVQAAKADDLGAQAVAKELGGLPVIANTSVPPGSVRVVLANDYTGPGSGLGDGAPPTAGGQLDELRRRPNNDAPPPSPILTAGSEHPECVN